MNKLSNSKIFNVLAIFVILSLLIPIGTSYSEELETLEVEVKYTNGDRRDTFHTHYIVYQDFSSTPFLEKPFETNPQNISLPEDHRYKIEVYVDGLYSESGYIDLKNSSEKLDIRIPLPGGVQFNVYYDNGEKPVDDAVVKLKSKNGEELSTGNTNQDGKTLRYWLQPTTLVDDFYSLDIYMKGYLVSSVPNIKVFTGTSIDQKITVPIPDVVEELLTFRLFDTESQLITKNDGDYSIVLADENLHPLFSSLMKDKGNFFFSNIPSGVYSVLIFNDGKRQMTWDDLPIPIVGNKVQFDLFEDEDLRPAQKPISVPLKDPTIEPLKEPISIPIKDPIQRPSQTPQTDPKIYESSVKEQTLSCNCVALRFDDVQDFWLHDVQLEMIDVFSKSNTPLTIGVVINALEFDETLIDVVKKEVKKGNIEIANHGLDHIPVTEYTTQELDNSIKESQIKFKKTFDVTPTVFIPPENIFTDDTKKLLVENGFTHFSSSFVYDSPPYSLQNESLYSFPRVSATGLYDPIQDKFKGIPADTTFSRLLDSLEEHGFAVVTIHPQEHSKFKDGEAQNEVNFNQIRELEKLIELIKEEGIDLVHISQIDQKVSKVNISTPSDPTSSNVIPTWLKNNAGWWRDGHIDNDTFVQGIQFLINEKIVQIPPTSQGSGGSEIPNWVKNNAGWWADGQISDDDFIQGINHLVNLGVIIIGL